MLPFCFCRNPGPAMGAPLIMMIDAALLKKNYYHICEKHMLVGHYSGSSRRLCTLISVHHC